MVRRAFSFIELVVSIVVIGIAFMSVPLILSETERSVELSIQQEAVMAGMTQLINVMSHHWDEEQTDDVVNEGYAKVLDTQGNAALACIDISGSRWRRGHFRESDRRRCYKFERNATIPSLLGPDGSDGGSMDDIDDFLHTNQTRLLGDGNASQQAGPRYDYKLDYNVTLDVDYIDDSGNYNQTVMTGTVPTTPQTHSTNIKMLTVTIITNDNQRVVLRSFMTNIGEYTLYSKSTP